MPATVIHLASLSVDRVVVYATALVLVAGIAGRLLHLTGKGFQAIRRASQLLDIVEELPDWKSSVDEEREQIAVRMDDVENWTAAIARDLGVEVREQPRRPRRRPPRPAA